MVVHQWTLHAKSDGIAWNISHPCNVPIRLRADPPIGKCAYVARENNGTESNINHPCNVRIRLWVDPPIGKCAPGKLWCNSNRCPSSMNTGWIIWFGVCGTHFIVLVLFKYIAAYGSTMQSRRFGPDSHLHCIGLSDTNWYHQKSNWIFLAAFLGTVMATCTATAAPPWNSWSNGSLEIGIEANKMESEFPFFRNFSSCTNERWFANWAFRFCRYELTTVSTAYRTTLVLPHVASASHVTASSLFILSSLCLVNLLFYNYSHGLVLFIIVARVDVMRIRCSFLRVQISIGVWFDGNCVDETTRDTKEKSE